jgi:ferredoxin-NADP reductase
MGIRFYPKGSSFKKELISLKRGDILVASQLAGEFVLPRNKKKKLVFIAGGIGITPFRSMIKYLIDTDGANNVSIAGGNKVTKRDIILFYSNKRAEDVVYEEVFSEAATKLGIKTIYAITDRDSAGYTGPINVDMLTSEVPDYEEGYFYISGPHSMVVGFKETLERLGVRKSHIKIDYFPGFA